VQLEAIPSSPITSHTREEAAPQLTTTSLQVVIETCKKQAVVYFFFFPVRASVMIKTLEVLKKHVDVALRNMA